MVALVIAVAAGGGLALADDDGRPGPADASGRAPVQITSDAPRFERVEALVGASDLVVRGTVAAVEPGRLFGDPGQAAVRSRLVTLAIDEVLAGAAHRGATVVIEEPGWLDDGTPIEVDGVPGAAAGTAAIWFLQAVEPLTTEDGSGPATYVITGPQGRQPLWEGALVGDGDDPITAQLMGLGLDGLRSAVRGLVRPPSP
jgi:hypothetical protein